MKKVKIGILGDGGWGTALALLLYSKGFSVTLWGAFSDYVRYLNRVRYNTKFLPKIRISAAIKITHDLASAIFDKELIILAVPSQYMREVLKKIKRFVYPQEAIYLSVTKGIELRSLKRMSEIIREELRIKKIAVLSGPTIALEVARLIPSTAVVAAPDIKLRRYLQDILMTERFRIYTNSDLIGVELGGSLKNIIAIACGVSDGLGFGTNTKAAILSRGLTEISRLGQAMGANLHTFSGISGLGDLVTTCISPYSRNRFVGEEIAKGKTLHKIISQMQMVAEGVPTTKAAYRLSLKYNVPMPITKEVYLVLYKNKSPHQAVRDLMTREKKEE